MSGSPPPDWVFESESPEATIQFARRLGLRLTGGEIILLRGELGAGKTCFAGGLADGLGITEPAVSPTYVIVRSYKGARGLTLHHMDFYRLIGDDQVEAAGVTEMPSPDSVTLVEWPERAPGAFRDWTLEMRLAVTGDNTRRITGRWGRAAVDSLKAGLFRAPISPSP